MLGLKKSIILFWLKINADLLSDQMRPERVKFEKLKKRDTLFNAYNFIMLPAEDPVLLGLGFCVLCVCDEYCVKKKLTLRRGFVIFCKKTGLS
jgi:hypothetical protein